MEKINKINQIPVMVFFLLIINDLLDTAGQLLIKKGLGTDDFTGIAPFIHHFTAASNPGIIFFWFGLMLYISNFFLWMYILSKIDLSIALPLASSSYILIPVMAILFLHEHIAPLRWAGLAAIIAGIYFISQSKAPGKAHE